LDILFPFALKSAAGHPDGDSLTRTALRRRFQSAPIGDQVSAGKQCTQASGRLWQLLFASRAVLRDEWENIKAGEGKR